MSPYRTFIVIPIEYDFNWMGTPYSPNKRERKYLHMPFTVQALNEKEAIAKVSTRVGWPIKDAEFMIK